MSLETWQISKSVMFLLVCVVDNNCQHYEDEEGNNDHGCN